MNSFTDFMGRNLSLARKDSFITTMFRGYSYILFSDNTLLGIAIFSLSFLNPSAGVHSLVAFLGALLFGKMTGHDKKSMVQGLYLYNPILVGLSIGFLFKISLLSILYTFIIGVFTFIVSVSFSSVFYNLFRLPILNLPFAITATVIYLAHFRYRTLLTFNPDTLNWLNIEFLPYYLHGLFKAIGTLIFLPYDYVGIVLLAVFFINSRINFFLILIGFYVGTCFHALFSSSLTNSLLGQYSFNFILISLALGGYFLIPSKRSYTIATLGVIVATIMIDAMTVFWIDFGIPVFTLPFAVTVLIVLYVLRISGYPYITYAFLKSPEENLEHWYNFKERFNTFLPAPKLPFSGEWSVYQGFDDKWTHQGLWKHAVDFVIRDIHSGETFKNDGSQLSDYLCYKKPVLSPVNGIVVAHEMELVDNPIGTVDKENNWGNYIIIYSDFGYYLEISHLHKGSVTVKDGDRVTVGQKIGACGNSGYSPQPHIHMQVQKYNYIGSPTIPFTFSHTIANGVFVKKLVETKAGDKFCAMTISRRVNNLMLFILDDRFTYECHIRGKRVGDLELMVRMDLDGSYFLEDQKRGSRLYFSHVEGLFSFTSFTGDDQSLLRLFYLALPSLPLTDKKVTYCDGIKGSLVYGKKPFNSFVKSFNHKLYSAEGSYESNGRGEVRGAITVKGGVSRDVLETSLELHDSKGFKSIFLKQGKITYELTLQS